jgi:hypothetical protein
MTNTVFLSLHVLSLSSMMRCWCTAQVRLEAVYKPTHMCCIKYLEGWSKKKVKRTLVQALRLCTGRTAHRGSTGIALPFHDRGTRRGSGVSVTPQPLFTTGNWPVTGGWVYPRAGLDRCGKSPPSPGFDLRTVQPVASRYTDWATGPTLGRLTTIIIKLVPVLLAKLVRLCHSDFNCSLSTGVNMTGVNKSTFF